MPDLIITHSQNDYHSESQMIPIINYKGQKIVFMADLLPSIGHIPLPYVMGYDTRPLQTLTEKSYFLEFAYDNDFVLFLQHDSINECCKLKKTETRSKETKKEEKQDKIVKETSREN